LEAARTDSTPRRQVLRRLRRNKFAQIGGFIMIVVTILTIFGPSIAPYDPLQQSLRERLQAPSPSHWLGTDQLGRDILSRLLVGSRISLSVGMIVGLLALLIGVPIGLAAGYFGDPLDSVLMRPMDVLLALPGILLAIAVVAILGTGLLHMTLAIAIASVPSFARVTRACTLQSKELLFVEAARSTGSGPLRIMWKHVLPNIASPLLVLFSMRVATALLTAAALGFLGLGAQPPEPEWGAMLSDGRPYMRSAPHVTTLPGLAIMLVVLGFNLFGDGLRDAIDPRMGRFGV
jgi:peptide/nickel transport system permease protein